MSQPSEFDRLQSVGASIFLFTSAGAALDMAGFFGNLHLGLVAYCIIATVGGALGGALMDKELRWAGAIAGAIAGPSGLLVVAWWVTGREMVYGVEVTVVELVGAGIPGGLVYWVLHSFGRARGMVTFDDGVITYRHATGRLERRAWADLESVEIETTGKFFGNLVLILHGRGGPCRIPDDAKGFSLLIERLKKLHGFDDEAILAAMFANEQGAFCCWRK